MAMLQSYGNEEQLELPLEIPRQLEQWEEQVEALLQIAYFTNSQPLLSHYKRSMLGKCIRSASDIISCESTRVHNNTASMIQWCLHWTEDAQALYWEQQQSTHRKTTNMRDSNGKRYWSVEHEHPVADCINMLLDGCSYATLKDWMYSYGKAVIVTQDELAKLPQLGENRYEKLGIRYSRFDPGSLTRTR